LDSVGPSTTGDALEQLERHISEKGLRMTRQRRLIAEVMLDSDGHLNIEQLFRSVRDRDPNVGYATIYRTLKLLTDCGLTTSSHFGDGAVRFESTVARDHHDHMICTACGAIIEFENEEIEDLQEAVCKEHNFQMVHHRMEIYGICSDCRC
jgi:Fur family ferric uptake transcriptional regulator